MGLPTLFKRVELNYCHPTLRRMNYLKLVLINFVRWGKCWKILKPNLQIFNFSKMFFVRCRHLSPLLLSSRLLSTTTANSGSLVAEKLTNRANVKVSGIEVSSFLQGLITNDIKSLDDTLNGGAIFTVFLNVQVSIFAYFPSHDQMIVMSPKLPLCC